MRAGSNVFERANRAAKVAGLVHALDAAARSNGADPIADPLRVVASIKVHGNDPAWWAIVARVGGVKPPSEPNLEGETVKAVIGEYLDRAAVNQRAVAS